MCSLPALEDIRECLSKTNLHHKFTQVFGRSIEARLLHPGGLLCLCFFLLHWHLELMRVWCMPLCCCQGGGAGTTATCDWGLRWRCSWDDSFSIVMFLIFGQAVNSLAVLVLSCVTAL